MPANFARRVPRTFLLLLITLAVTGFSACGDDTSDNPSPPKESVDLCEKEECEQPEQHCDGDFAVTYSGNGVCDPRTGSCDFTAVSSRNYCTHGCLSGFCQPEEHPQCFNVQCPRPADTCEGDIALSYSGDGSCVELDGSCDFSAVEARTDCAASGQTCDGGRCVAAGPGD
ncbi:hypothetical protein [Bradymonas sediminis]|uniref:Uncharacterized protein n=1 Tax=Bradymonas sediminis TaxID=1548548 RepID=A0A2Z4FGS6_9DELT|nr:hypothetical protein [Bradymonas sediminis]AWV87806.1 hypothetical protein DN745_00035 [Bradymonas sediminis]TDP73900.1 hypothetical protein DFR33_105234 [Bradymonas sediminis]